MAFNGPPTAGVLFRFQRAKKLLVKLEQEGHAVAVARKFLFRVSGVNGGITGRPRRKPHISELPPRELDAGDREDRLSAGRRRNARTLEDGLRAAPIA